jgi:hypothetical protein
MINPLKTKAVREKRRGGLYPTPIKKKPTNKRADPNHNPPVIGAL